MPYEIDPNNRKCVRKSDTKKRVGCTKGPVKKYLSALHANVNENLNDEWYKDIIDNSITLTIDELEVGDIVIPTCVKQQEYVVKNISVDMLNNLEVILKINEDGAAGGVIISNRTELGKNCKFEVISRKNLNEETDDLGWVYEITDEFDIVGNVYKCNHIGNPYFDLQIIIDGIELDNEGEPIIYYTSKSDVNAGNREAIEYYDKPNHITGREVDRLIDDGYWEKIPLDKSLFADKLNENEKEKPLLTEGRYDSITRKVVKDIMKVVTSTNTSEDLIQATLPWDINYEEQYEQEGMAFDVELNVAHQTEKEGFVVQSAIADGDKNTIMMTIVIDPEKEPKLYEKLFYKIQEDVRHEIEHFTQMGDSRIEDRPIYKGNTANLKTVYGHHKNVIEIPALVHGFYRRAKLEKLPIDDVMREDLDTEIERGTLTKKQAEKLLKLWLDYAKKNLPSAVYSKE